jgi:CHAD domain-containing protein
MSFELERTESHRKGIRRIARKEMDNAVDSLNPAPPGSRDEAVHEARKCFKKIRAVLRLVRPVIDEVTYRAENTCFRDAGRPLTEVRDAKILIETLDKLTEHFNEHIAGRSFTDVRKALQANLRTVRKRVLDEQNAFTVVTETVRQARKRVKDWADVPNRWRAFGKGLEGVYQRTLAAFEDAVTEPTVEKLHEWRKQTKYLRYQLEVLRPLWPERLTELAQEADKLGELLGDGHDLAVLRQILTDHDKSIAEADEAEILLALIDRRRAELEEEAFQLGQRFFLDKPREFARHLKGYWKTWRAQAEATSRPQPAQAPVLPA